MKRIINLLLVGVLSLTSCIMFAPTGVEPKTRLLLSGECLSGTELQYVVPEADYQQVYDDYFLFRFSMELTDHEIKKDGGLWSRIYNDTPSKSLYDSFGKNKSKVRKEFNGIFEVLSEYYLYDFHQYDFAITTILYNGGISLTANKEFAGFKPGEDLAPAIKSSPRWGEYIGDNLTDPVISTTSRLSENAGEILDIPMEYISLAGDEIRFSIPMADYQLVEDEVTFELNIPVKVVSYLEWINDKLSDPDAPVPYKDEVLHCKFTTGYCLK